jgi:SAM-dependent methyltransferase
MDGFDQLSDFYDVDYPDSSDHGFLTRLASAVDPEHLLEIPCGAGRNVAPLLEGTSRNVTFADVAQGMVEETAKRIPASERRRAQAVVADMRALDRRGEFDLVVCPREAFQLLPPAEAPLALQSLAASLVEGGLLVVDLFDFSRRSVAAADAPPDYFSPQDHGWVEDWTRANGTGELTVTRRRRQTGTHHGVHFEMRYTVRPRDRSSARVLDLAFDMTNYRDGEFRELARRSGLDVLAALAGYGPAAADAPAARTVFLLAHGRSQQGRDRVERIRDEIGAGLQAPDDE